MSINITINKLSHVPYQDGKIKILVFRNIFSSKSLPIVDIINNVVLWNECIKIKSKKIKKLDPKKDKHKPFFIKLVIKYQNSYNIKWWKKWVTLGHIKINIIEAIQLNTLTPNINYILQNSKSNCILNVKFDFTNVQKIIVFQKEYDDNICSNQIKDKDKGDILKEDLLKENLLLFLNEMYDKEINALK